MSLADELERLAELYGRGSLTDAEFSRAKEQVLREAEVPAPSPVSSRPPVRFLQTLSRSTADCWIGGVCGGLGAHTAVPSWCWRVLFCVLLLGYGIGVLPYVVLWICLPTDADRLRAVALQDRPPEAPTPFHRA